LGLSHPWLGCYAPLGLKDTRALKGETENHTFSIDF